VSCENLRGPTKNNYGGKKKKKKKSKQKRDHKRSKMMDHIGQRKRHRGKLGASSWQNLQELLDRPREISSKPNACSRYNCEFKISCSIRTLLFKLEEKFRNFRLIVRPEGIRLTGGGATCVLSQGSESQLNDLDFTIYLEDNRAHNFADILLCEEEVLSEMVEEQLGIRLSLFEIYQLFFRESFRISEKQEAWSLFRCGSESFGIDIRVVARNRRNFVFSIDSFEIILDPLLKSAKQLASGLNDGGFFPGDYASTTESNEANGEAGEVVGKENTTTHSSSSKTEVEVECNYGDFKEACVHLHTKLLKTWDPASVRRGLFRYCLELAKGNRPCAEDKQRLEAAFVEELYHEFAAWKNDGDEFQRSIHKFLHTHKRHAFQVLAHLHSILLTTEVSPALAASLQRQMLAAVEETLAVHFM